MSPYDKIIQINRTIVSMTNILAMNKNNTKLTNHIFIMEFFSLFN